MNCSEIFAHQVKEHGGEIALWHPRTGGYTFEELYEFSARTQYLLKGERFGPGDTVLLADTYEPRSFGIALGIIATGASVLFVDRSLPLATINSVIEKARPRAFIANSLGRLWGLRVRSIRQIPWWVSARNAVQSSSADLLHIENVSEDQPAIVEIVPGETGSPKGIVWAHGNLRPQIQMQEEHLGYQKGNGTNLCLYPFFIFANLTAGRGTLIVPPSWSNRSLKRLRELPAFLRPTSLTCSPAFLEKIMKLSLLPNLQEIHISGALTSCDLLEKAFQQWPQASFLSFYGLREIDPITVTDSKTAVEKSRQRGFSRCAFLGKPISAIDVSFPWVTGPHLGPGYLYNDEESKRLRKQENGRSWQKLSLPIRVEDGEWWVDTAS